MYVCFSSLFKSKSFRLIQKEILLVAIGHFFLFFSLHVPILPLSKLPLRYTRLCDSSFFFPPLCFYECGKQRFLLIDTSVILACFLLSFALRSSSAMLSEHLLPSSFPLSFSALLFLLFWSSFRHCCLWDIRGAFPSQCFFASSAIFLFFFVCLFWSDSHHTPFFFFLTLVLREAGNGGLGETALSVNTEKCYISYFSLFCFIFLYNNVYLLICF